jgi:hypothetical protein
MGYFFLTSPTFLLVKLHIPQVMTLLRKHFNGSWIWMISAGSFSTCAFAVAGRPSLAIVSGGIAAFAFVMRRWLLQRMDEHIARIHSGDSAATRPLRGLHWTGMVCNAATLGIVLTMARGF